MDTSPHSILRAPRVIVLAAGHGGRDSGAVDGHNVEREQAIRIVDAMAVTLRAWLPAGAKVVVAPHEHDTHETIAWINRQYGWGDAWALEVHQDSAETVRGKAEADLRCGVYHGPSGSSKEVARAMAAEMIRQGAHKSSWHRPESESRFKRLAWIGQVKCVSHLLEAGFVQGRGDAAHLEKLAGVLCAGVGMAFAGRGWKA